MRQITYVDVITFCFSRGSTAEEIAHFLKLDLADVRQVIESATLADVLPTKEKVT